MNLFFFGNFFSANTHRFFFFGGGFQIVSVYFFHPVPLELNSRTATSKISCAINATNKLNNSTLFLCQCLRTVAYDDTRATAERIPNVSRWHRLSHKKVMADEDDLGLAIPVRYTYHFILCINILYSLNRSMKNLFVVRLFRPPFSPSLSLSSGNVRCDL